MWGALDIQSHSQNSSAEQPDDIVGARSPCSEMLQIKIGEERPLGLIPLSRNVD